MACSQQFRLACRFDGFQPRLGCSPAFSPQSHRFMIHVQVLGDLRIAGSCCCCQNDLPTTHQPLGTGGATHQMLQHLLLHRTNFQGGRTWMGHARVLLLVLPSIVYHIFPTYFCEAVLAQREQKQHRSKQPEKQFRTSRTGVGVRDARREKRVQRSAQRCSICQVLPWSRWGKQERTTWQYLQEEPLRQYGQRRVMREGGLQAEYVYKLLYPLAYVSPEIILLSHDERIRSIGRGRRSLMPSTYAVHATVRLKCRKRSTLTHQRSLSRRVSSP